MLSFSSGIPKYSCIPFQRMFTFGPAVGIHLTFHMLASRDGPNHTYHGPKTMHGDRIKINEIKSNHQTNTCLH